MMGPQLELGLAVETVRLDSLPSSHPCHAPEAQVSLPGCRQPQTAYPPPTRVPAGRTALVQSPSLLIIWPSSFLGPQIQAMLRHLSSSSNLASAAQHPSACDEGTDSAATGASLTDTDGDSPTAADMQRATSLDFIRWALVVTRPVQLTCQLVVPSPALHQHELLCW
jgi:hypothetical protein